MILSVLYLGRLDYATSLALQKTLVELRHQQRNPPDLWDFALDWTAPDSGTTTTRRPPGLSDGTSRHPCGETAKNPGDQQDLKWLFQRVEIVHVSP